MASLWRTGGALVLVLMVCVAASRLSANESQPAGDIKASGDEKAAGDGKAALSPAAHRNIQRLVLDFTKARRNPAKRAALVQKAAEMGAPAGERLLAVIEKELSPQVRTYGERISKLAASFEEKRARTIDAEEVKRLRSSVLDLTKNPDLTKEMIVETGDPAMQRLGEILLPDLRAVSESSVALAKQRAALVAAGQMWEMCAAVAARQSPNEDGTTPEPPSFESSLRAEEEVALQIATAVDPQTRKALAVNAQLVGKLDPEEARCIAACNLTRGLLGLKLLEIDLRLCEAARDHSNDMRTVGFFAHESPVAGKKTPWDRAKLFGTTASGENIAVGVQQGNAANLMWFHSPGHFRNMLGEHVRIGVGRSSAHWTELFGT